jgi:hypothetical protein
MSARRPGRIRIAEAGAFDQAAVLSQPIGRPIDDSSHRHWCQIATSPVAASGTTSGSWWTKWIGRTSSIIGAPISSTKASCRQIRLIDKIDNTTNALSTLRDDVEQLPDAAIRGRDRPMPPDRDKCECSTRRIYALFRIAFVLAVTTTACAPVPCASGYSDPNWCRHPSGGGGGGG